MTFMKTLHVEGRAFHHNSISSARQALPHPSLCVTPLWTTITQDACLHDEETDVQLPHHESQAEDVLPEAVGEIQPAKGNDGALLLCHHRVHPHLLHHGLIHCCRGQGQGKTAAYHSLTEGDWLQPPKSLGFVPL